MGEYGTKENYENLQKEKEQIEKEHQDEIDKLNREHKERIEKEILIAKVNENKLNLSNEKITFIFNAPCKVYIIEKK